MMNYRNCTEGIENWVSYRPYPSYCPAHCPSYYPQKPCQCCCKDSQSAPFLSSYIEAVGSTQNVANRANIVFDIAPDTLDVAGNDISISRDGTVFTINREGLYRVEWSVNLASSNNPVLITLLENGEPVSALSNNALVGNYSSGALIQVGANNLPYTVSLHNYGAPLTIENPLTALNTAASMRISRFADGPRR